MKGAGLALPTHDPQEYFPPRYAYEISRLNKPKVTALSILALTDASNFSKRREQIIYTMLGIGRGPEIRDRSRKKILGGIISSYLDNGLNAKESKENSQRLAEGLLKEGLTPYEATGIIKELCPDLRAKEMKNLWTKFSIVTGLRYLNDSSLQLDWEQTISEKSIKPKITNLKQSLEEKEQDSNPTTIKRKYYENHSHLKSSQGKDTNWAEVLSNLNPDQAGLVKALLESSKDSILKEKATRDCLWPQPSEQEIENRRLNNLLNTLGNKPTGRTQRYSRIFLNEEPKNFPKAIPKPNEIVLTSKEIEIERKFISNLKKLEELDEVKEPNELPKKNNAPNQQPWYKIFLKMGKINKISTPKAKESFDKALELLKKHCAKHLSTYLSKESLKPKVFHISMLSKSTTLKNSVLRILLEDQSPNDSNRSQIKKYATELIDHVKEDPETHKIPESLIVSSIEHLAIENPKSSNITNLVDLFENQNQFRELFNQYPYNQSKCLIQCSKRDISEPAKPIALPPRFISISSSVTTPVAPENSRFIDIYTANTKGVPLDLEKAYGPAKLSSLHLASWYGGLNGVKTGAELSAIIEKRRKLGIGLNPKDIEGNTPLHKSTPYATQELLNAGANPTIKNEQGLTAAKTNKSGESCKKMILDASKKETIKQIADSPSLEI